MVKKVVEQRRFFNWKWLLALVILAVIIYVIWFFFFSYASCDNWDCFNARLERCDRVKFIGENEKMIFEYSVRGKSGDNCKVGVELLQGELNNQDSIALEGKAMLCNLPRGVVMIPESNIGYCHGLLKEGLQDLIIKELHTILVQNLGRLNLELLDVSGA
ncbi:MAG: hypothetical protein KKF50_01755 [Nanoarchaeota archaeon]|nr:hypothetical protein [Nanoarchaeota archaeon]